MRILIIGSGGREHALAWKISQRADVEELYVAPGNGGTASLAVNVAIKDSDIEGLVAFAKEKAIDLVVPGPELPLTLGVVDAMQAAGIACFGPVAACAKLEGSKAHRFEMPGNPNFLTRDLVTMWGTIEGEPFFFLVSHWPSRLGGKEASDAKREAAAAQCRRIADSVRKQNPNTKVVIMGDLNDDATDKSITEVLGAKANIKKLADGDLYSPYIELLKAGYGTLGYRDSWNLFDNIIVSENLATGSTGELKLQQAPKSKFYGNIFSRPYMMQREGQYRNYPLRTFVSNNFQNGFSDHLPVFIYIGK